MSNESDGKINIFGVLSFADESILKLELGHKFYAEAMNLRDILNILEKFGPIDDRSFLKVELDRLNCIDQDVSRSNKIFVVKNSFRNIEEAKLEIDLYLLPIFKIIILFKECAINMPILYYCLDEKSLTYNVKRFSFFPNLYNASNASKLSLEDEEVEQLKNFIKTIDEHEINMSFKNNILQLALNYYDLSYYAEVTPAALLNLSISLEALFNPSDSELRYRISRNVATLIGKDKIESQKIYKFIKAMYAKRSKLVHTGAVGDVIKKDEIALLRSYVRTSIKSFYKYTLECGKSKKDLLEELELTNFGDSPVNDLPW
jgi:hypothetical protein